MNAFFESGPDTNRFALTYTGEATALVADKPPFSEKADKYLSLLRQVFMFGSGTFALFYMTLTAALFIPGTGPKLYSYLFAIFLTYAGSGSIRNLKNLAVPAAVIALAVAVVFFATVLLGRETADHYFWDSIYLLPVVLIVAKLVQSWASKK